MTAPQDVLPAVPPAVRPETRPVPGAVRRIAQIPGGAAAVGWDHRVVVIGFGLENLSSAQRAAALADLETWLD